MGKTTIKTNSSGWLSVNNYISYKKAGGMVYIKGESSGTLSIGGSTWNNLGTLPEGYRPSVPVNFIALDRSNIKPCWGQVTNTGIVRIYGDSGVTFNYWEYGATFPV